MKHFKTVCRWLLLAPILFILLFEEWGWEPLARCFAALGRHPGWGAAERWIRSLPPWGALLVFGIPVLALFPVKLLALYLFAEGHMATSFTMIVVVKLAGTAIAARLFQLTEPALLQIRWFARLYLPWKTWKDRKLGQLRRSAPWQKLQEIRNRVKLWTSRTWRDFKTSLL
ncbi:MAG: hypothetical protein V4451_09310 [Pseudomonadota bacterium]